MKQPIINFQIIKTSRLRADWTAKIFLCLAFATSADGTLITFCLKRFAISDVFLLYSSFEWGR